TPGGAEGGDRGGTRAAAPRFNCAIAAAIAPSAKREICGRGSAAAANARGHLARDPAADDLDHVGALARGQLVAARDLVPALEARPAARRRRVLGDEHRMTAVRRLAPVLLRGRRGEALPGDLVGVPANRLHPAQLDERAVAPVAEVEARAEVVRADPVEAGVDAGGVDGVAHRRPTVAAPRYRPQGYSSGTSPVSQAPVRS